MTSAGASTPPRQGQALLLGLDIGTSSSQAVLATSDGTLIRHARRPHQVSMPQPGWYEQDADAVWWADAVSLIRELVGGPDPANVDAVCVSGLGPAVLAADGHGRPLRPGILYGIDVRAAGLAAQIERSLGGPGAVLDRCGSQLSSQSAGPKLAWLARHEPSVWKQTRRFLMAHTYVVHQLTGEYILDHQSASQTAPLYDRRTQAWITDWAEELAPGLPLPRLAWPAEIAGRVTPHAARQTGLRAGTPVAAGTIDAWAEAESAGVRDPGDLMLMYGSTMFLVAVTASPLLHAALWATPGNYPGQSTLAAGMASSGSLTSWLSGLLGTRDFPGLLQEAELSPPGSNGILALPYFAGERTPFCDPAARGVMAGLSLRHSAGDLYRALLESTAFGVRHNLEAFRDAGFSARRVVAVGGGTQHPLWPRIVSSVTGLAQELPEVRIGASFGDAKFAAVAIGAACEGDTWNKTQHVVTGDTEPASRYGELYALYRELHEATASIQHALAGWQPP